MGVAPSWGRDHSRIRALDERRAWGKNVCRGYAGWLALNSEFIREQQGFLIRWQDQIAGFGLQRQVRDHFPRMSVAPLSLTPESFQEYVTERERFLSRWQLVNLAGPFLPAPIRTSMPMLQSADNSERWAKGSTIFLATIFPLPDRKMLREMMEGTLDRDNSPEHLREWLELVRSESQSKKTITRYARIFLLQHFWRVLHSRHATALEGCHVQLRRAFAAYFFPNVDDTCDVKAETIRKDLESISKSRGGPNWQYPLEVRRDRFRRNLMRK